MWDNATLNEELWHLTGLMTLRSEWEEQGRPGDFNLYENARTAEMFDELAERKAATIHPSAHFANFAH